MIRKNVKAIEDQQENQGGEQSQQEMTVEQMIAMVFQKQQAMDMLMMKMTETQRTTEKKLKL